MDVDVDVDVEDGEDEKGRGVAIRPSSLPGPTASSQHREPLPASYMDCTALQCLHSVHAIRLAKLRSTLPPRCRLLQPT